MIEVRQVFEMSDFPAEVQTAAGGVCVFWLRGTPIQT
jgi:hypothetical protein